MLFREFLLTVSLAASSFAQNAPDAASYNSATYDNVAGMAEQYSGGGDYGAWQFANSLYDGNSGGGASVSRSYNPAAKTYSRGTYNYQYLMDLKGLLSSGQRNDGKPWAAPFMFHDSNGTYYQAQGAGLEGFLYTKKEIESRMGSLAFAHHLTDYFNYLDYLLSGNQLAADFRKQVSDLKNSNLPYEQKNASLNQLLEKYVSSLQQQLVKADGAQWIRKARIYQMFPRAYNIAGRRQASGQPGGINGQEVFFKDFRASDFDYIKRMGFDTLYVMGICPIGERNRSGSAGGSPFSIKDPEAINPLLGSEADFKRFVADAHNAGFKVIIDFVVNHTSMDSKLLDENPYYYVTQPGTSPQPKHYFDYKWKNSTLFWVAHGGFDCWGSFYDWIDTAQIDYSNPATQKRMTEVVKSWVSRFDVDGFRVDMAYLALNSVFGRTWKRSMPPAEFYTVLFSQVRALKPTVGFVAEAYDNQQDLSNLGFDMIYSKNENRTEGQTGWYNALEAGNQYSEASAINRAAYLSWQVGGAGGVNFIGNHDEPAPEKVFGNKLPSSLVMTLLSPSAIMVYNGAEVGTDNSIPTEQKTLPFNVPNQIDWSGGKQYVKDIYNNILPAVKNTRAYLGDYIMEPVWNCKGQLWTGYLLKSTTYPGRQTVVIGNMTGGGTGVDIDAPYLSLHAYFGPGEYKIVNVASK